MVRAGYCRASLAGYSSVQVELHQRGIGNFSLFFIYFYVIFIFFLSPAYVSYVIAIYSDSALSPLRLSFGFWNNKGGETLVHLDYCWTIDRLGAGIGVFPANQGRLWMTQANVWVWLVCLSSHSSAIFSNCGPVSAGGATPPHMQWRVNTSWAPACIKS